MPDKRQTPVNPLLVAPRTRTVHLFPGEYAAQLDELQEQIEEALQREETEYQPSAVASPSIKLAKKHAELARTAKQAATTVTLQQLTSTEREEVAEECPPREDEKSDQIAGFNRDRYQYAAIAKMIREPAGITAEMVKETKDRNPESEWRKLVVAANELSEGRDLPKDNMLSLVRSLKGSDSEQPEDGESPRPGSKGKSQRRGRSTTTS